ncbi:TPA: hypothetical protein NJZ13_000522 [Vibrio parahaemolyticus]|nr:hypothetical protein [Vibrio parahaemolyticus]HCH1698466.1 hypothetical protein [Vibrio parahaemolyticus]
MLEKIIPIWFILVISIVSLIGLGVLIGMNIVHLDKSMVSIIVSSSIVLFVFFTTQFLSHKAERRRVITSKYEELFNNTQSIEFCLRELEKTRLALASVDLDQERSSKNFERLKQLLERFVDKHSSIVTIINVYFVNDISSEQKKALKDHFEYLSKLRTQKTIEYLNAVADNPLSESSYINVLQGILETVKGQHIKNAL